MPETYAAPETAVHLARVANDGMAELVRRHPDRFVAFAAALPMNHPDEAVKEMARAWIEWGRERGYVP